MEVALHIREAAEVCASMKIGDAAGWERSSRLGSWLEAVVGRFSAMQVNRYYIGTEFCENLLPSHESVRALAATRLPMWAPAEKPDNTTRSRFRG